MYAINDLAGRTPPAFHVRTVEDSERQAMRFVAIAPKADIWALVLEAGSLASARDHALPYEIKGGGPASGSPGMEVFIAVVDPHIAERLSLVAAARGINGAVCLGAGVQ